MGNEKLNHLNSLIAMCTKIQNELLSEGRNVHNDYVIVNLFNLVKDFPGISSEQLQMAYSKLMKASYAQTHLYIDLTVGGGLKRFEAKRLF